MIPIHEFERALRRANKPEKAHHYGRNTTTVELQTIQSDEATISEVFFRSNYDGLGFSGTGTAKRAPGDSAEFAIGARLACGRAFIELGIRMIAYANEAVAEREASDEA